MRVPETSTWSPSRAIRRLRFFTRLCCKWISMSSTKNTSGRHRRSARNVAESPPTRRARRPHANRMRHCAPSEACTAARAPPFPRRASARLGQRDACAPAPMRCDMPCRLRFQRDIVRNVARQAELGRQRFRDVFVAKAFAFELLGTRARGVFSAFLSSLALGLVRPVDDQHDLAFDARPGPARPANSAASAGNVRATTSSWSFVSSRHTAASRRGNAFASTFSSVGATRFGLS